MSKRKIKKNHVEEETCYQAYTNLDKIVMRKRNINRIASSDSDSNIVKYNHSNHEYNKDIIEKGKLIITDSI